MRWTFWMFAGIALVGLVILAFVVATGSVRVCGRMSGCTTYSLAETPGSFLVSTSPAVLLLVAGSYGAWWWRRVTTRR